MNEKRIPWIDTAKAIGIFAIVLGHCSSGSLQTICFSFNSVIFFLLAGMTFCRKKEETDQFLSFDSERKLKRFCIEKVQTLLIPYIVWGMISILIYSVVGRMTVSVLELSRSNFAVKENILFLLYGNSDTGYFEWNRPLWFLPCLLVVEFIWFFILKILDSNSVNRKRKWFLYFMVMLLALANMVVLSFCEYKFVLPFELETAISMTFFFGVGLILRNGTLLDFLHNSCLYKKKSIQILVVFLGVFLTVLLAIANGGTDTRSDYFSNVFLYIVNALIACFVVVFLSRVMFHNKMLEYIGKRTMAILVMHKFPIMFLKLLFPVFNEKILDGNILVELIVCFLTMGSCLIAERVISIALPEVFGKKRVSK